VNSEYRTLREQMRLDFKTVMSAFAVQCDRFGGAISAVEKAINEVRSAFEGQETAMKSYFARTDERMGTLIELVERHDTRLDRVESRLDALEQRDAS